MLLHYISSSAYMVFRFLGHHCRYQYCWLCLANYALILKDGNTQHRSDCRHHTSNIATDRLHPDLVIARWRNRMALYRSAVQPGE